MIVTLVRTGGFTGIPLKKTIDTSKLPKYQGKKIEELVASANFVSIGQSASQPPKPDSFEYTISVEDAGLPHVIKLNEHALTRPIKELVETFFSA